MITTDPLCDEELQLLPIVVGIHLDAERHDRPLAARLCEAIRRWQHAFCDGPICRPLVISDALYLGDDSMHFGPVISLVHARVNALSAALVERLPVIHTLRSRLVIQADLMADPVRLCAWVAEECDGTALLDRLIDVELDDFLESVAASAPAL